MAPPVPTLPEIAGTLALSFTGVDGPAVQRPVTSPPTTSSPTTTAPASAPPAADPDVPTPPTLPDLPGESPAPADPNVPAEPTPPEPSPTVDPIDTTAPPQPEPTSDIVEDYPPPASTAAEPGPYDMPPSPSNERTDSGGVLPPSDKRFFFELFAGGTKALRGNYPSYYGGSSMDFKLEGAVGGHFKGRPELGGSAFFQASFGTINTLTIGPRFQWDKPLLDSHAIFSHTNLMLAYRAAALDYYSYGFFGDFVAGTYHAGMFGVGWGLRAIVADRMLLTFRPVNVSIAGPAPLGVIQIDWDVFGGIGVVW